MPAHGPTVTEALPETALFDVDRSPKYPPRFLVVT